MLRTFFLFAFVSFATTILAQPEPGIVILARSKNDGVWIRWAPTNAVNWQLGNRYGYTIERFTLSPNGDLEQNSKVLLTPAPLKPLTPSEFLPLSERSDEVATLQELLYGEGPDSGHSGDDFASILAKNDELQNRFGIAMLMCDLSLDAARAGGLFYNDTNAVKGRRYIYRIAIANEPATDAVPPAVAIVSHTDELPLLIIKDLTVDFGDRSATIQWPTLLHKGVYTAYYIERSTDGKTYKRLADLPYVHMSEELESERAVYLDSLEANLKEYYYRIRGITPFAEIGPYSNVVKGEGRENLFGQLVLREATVFETNKVNLVWNFPSMLEKQISGFMVSRANNPDGPYVDVTRRVLSERTRLYTDQTVFNNTYYIVKAINKDGVEATRSFPYLVQVADNTPPVTPVGLSGNIAASGRATLEWQANPDHDLLGYRVFRSNAREEEPVEVTKEILNGPSYVDTLNIRVLNKKVFYFVVAVDRNYNTSDYSQAYELSRPDIIPPAAPVFTETGLSKDSLTLAWINSASGDVARTELIRIEGNGLRRVLRTWSPRNAVTKWVDKSLTPGSTISYKLVAHDSAGNVSETISRRILFEPGVRNSVTDIKATVDREARKIVIEWRNPQPSEKCIIYRKINGSPLTIYKTLEGNIESFTDESININNRYSYKIQPLFQSGIRSMISQEVNVVY